MGEADWAKYRCLCVLGTAIDIAAGGVEGAGWASPRNRYMQVSVRFERSWPNYSRLLMDRTSQDESFRRVGSNEELDHIIQQRGTFVSGTPLSTIFRLSNDICRIRHVVCDKSQCIIGLIMRTYVNSDTMTR